MKTWQKIALGVVALGLVGKLAGVDTQEQPKVEQTSQPKVEQEQQMTPEEVVNNMVKNELPTYNTYTYMRDEYLASAKNLAQAQQYRGKLQVPHMKMIGIKDNLVALQSDNGCNMILTLPTDEEKRDMVVTPLGWLDDPMVFVTISRIGRDTDGTFIYMGTIEGVSDTVLGGLK